MLVHTRLAKRIHKHLLPPAAKDTTSAAQEQQQPEGLFLRLLITLVKVELHVALHDVLAPSSASEALPPTTNPNYGVHFIAWLQQSHCYCCW